MKRVFFLILGVALMIISACEKDEVAVTGIFSRPSVSSLTLEIGNTQKLIAFVIPDNATNKRITWNSDNPDIAIVNSKGEITAKAIGTATITAATSEGGYMANWIVEVIPAGQKKMTITQEGGYGSLVLYIGGRSTITIDWNDGSAIESHTLNSEPNSVNGYFHNYSNRSSGTITLTGGNINNLSVQAYIISLDLKDNIALNSLGCNLNRLKELDVSHNILLKNLSCNYNQIESLDLSKNTSLERLDCSVNKLTVLDLSNNKALTDIKCQTNQLSIDALNALFKTLHSNEGTKKIYIGDNPGTNGCDRSIATNKGWTVSEW